MRHFANAGLQRTGLAALVVGLLPGVVPGCDEGKPTDAPTGPAAAPPRPLALYRYHCDR